MPTMTLLSYSPRQCVSKDIGGALSRRGVVNDFQWASVNARQSYILLNAIAIYSNIKFAYTCLTMFTTMQTDAACGESISSTRLNRICHLMTTFFRAPSNLVLVEMMRNITIIIIIVIVVIFIILMSIMRGWQLLQYHYQEPSVQCLLCYLL